MRMIAAALFWAAFLLGCGEVADPTSPPRSVHERVAQCDSEGQCTCPSPNFPFLGEVKGDGPPPCLPEPSGDEPDAAPPDAAPPPGDAAPTPPPDAGDPCLDLEGRICVPLGECQIRLMPEPGEECLMDCTSFGHPAGEGMYPNGAPAQAFQEACFPNGVPER